ncbi:DUF3551 domain-containing protein [Bradyrhizobium sp. BR 10261]|uniref:DUF3551 domain-containing protein n=1 Tax=Bradyrhizobium sp. BR 10261 TaxID=2749992 RepID=UPI001C64F48B|nr:DUF3551 domain-containing protein [Bradyrhizobium sp. BR 10261]MBW7961396.1 DUF3551 domain-containing protein [Bradyrhizobium sp. BR 10261]
MQRILVVAAVIAASTAATTLIPEEQAAAKEYSFCRLDYDSGMRSCAFETIDRCVATIAGRGGSCSRSPASETIASFAHAPKMHTATDLQADEVFGR